MILHEKQSMAGKADSEITVTCLPSPKIRTQRRSLDRNFAHRVYNFFLLPARTGLDHEVAHQANPPALLAKDQS